MSHVLLVRCYAKSKAINSVERNGRILNTLQVEIYFLRRQTHVLYAAAIA
jgi:hypothetical protein